MKKKLILSSILLSLFTAKAFAAPYIFEENVCRFNLVNPTAENNKPTESFNFQIVRYPDGSRFFTNGKKNLAPFLDKPSTLRFAKNKFGETYFINGNEVTFPPYTGHIYEGNGMRQFAWLDLKNLFVYASQYNMYGVKYCSELTATPETKENLIYAMTEFQAARAAAKNVKAATK